MSKLAIPQMVEDFDFYPRSVVDSTNVAHIAEAVNAGVELPPIILERKTNRIVDGFHRRRAYGRMWGDDAVVPVEFRKYETDAEMYADAVRLNASHGRNLTASDRVRVILRAEELQIDPDSIASALNMNVDAVGRLRTERVGRMRVASSPKGQNGSSNQGGGNGDLVPLKMPVRHMAGRTLTKAQVEAMPRLGGNQQTFYVNQLLTLVESNMLDTDNEALVERLAILRDKLNEMECLCC